VTFSPRLLTVSALLAAGAALPLAPAASADEAPAPAVVFGQDAALVRSDATLSPDSLSTLEAASTAVVKGFSASADGSRFASLAVSAAGDATSFTFRTQVAVRDAGGRLVRVLDDRSMTSNETTVFGSTAYRPALDATGANAVWTAISAATNQPVLKTSPVASGAATSIPGSAGLAQPQYLGDGSLLVKDTVTGVLKTLPLVGGLAAALPGLPTGVGAFAVSPDSSRIAFDAVTLDGDDDLWSAPLTQVAGAWVVGLPTRLATDFASTDDGPSFSHDGSTVYWSQDVDTDADQLADDSDIFSVPADGSAPATDRTLTPNRLETSAAGIAVDPVAPAAPGTDAPFTLNGTSATIRWTLPADADLSGVVITHGGTETFVAAPATSFVDTGLELGETYLYSIAALDRSGNRSDASERSLTASTPKMSFFSPTSTGGTAAPFRLTLPPTGTYTVQWRANSAGPLQTLAQHSGPTYVFPGVSGSSYGFAISVTDEFGNSTPAAGAGLTEVPYDQTRATYTGSHVTSALRDRWLGSATTLRAAGAAAKIVVNGTRLQVIGERCATCGVMDVYVDGVRVAGIDTRATARQARQVLYTRAVSRGTHTLLVRARGTAGRSNVVLDGFGVRH
jgi:hypothetical protein